MASLEEIRAQFGVFAFVLRALRQVALAADASAFAESGLDEDDLLEDLDAAMTALNRTVPPPMAEHHRQDVHCLLELVVAAHEAQPLGGSEWVLPGTEARAFLQCNGWERELDSDEYEAIYYWATR